MTELRKTNCHFCGYLCAFEAQVEEGRVTGLVPDPTRYPYDPDILKGCRRWKMNLEVLDDPARVNHPLRRVGERGSGQWERVSWEEALDGITSRLKGLINLYGPETLASAIGGPHASFWPLHRFMSLLGSPNNMGIGQICWNPRIWMDMVTFGWTIEPDIDLALTGAVFIWGTNPAQSDNSAFWRHLLKVARSDIPLVVIDPRSTQAAAQADLWLPLKPGTDCALALGLLHVIIAEGLCDHDFVERWCHGFDELQSAVAPYSPQAVADICGIPARDVRSAARIFAKAKAAALVSGRGIDQTGANVAATHRAIACLRAVTGNLDKPGACVITEQSDFVPEAVLELGSSLTKDQRARCLNTPHTPLQCYEGYAKVNALTERLGRTMPLRYLTSAHPDLVLKAMCEGKPYPIRALVVQATNPLLTYADTKRVFKALSSLDLLVVLEYYLTPTASLADYVLPIAGAIERPLFQAHGGVANIAYGGPAAVEPYHERRTDYDVFRELGVRFGQESDWPWPTLKDAFAATLAPAGMTWEEYCCKGIYYRPPAFFKHEEPGTEGRRRGFATTTGKVELASEILAELGGQRVPTYLPQGPAAAPPQGPAAAPPQGPAAAPLTLITGARKQPYNASMFLGNPRFRKAYPKPLAEMSEATAEAYGLAPGDEVEVSTKNGTATFTFKAAPMRDGVVSIDYGWWYPEWKPGAPDFGGIWASNANLLTDCSLKGGEAMIGTWSYNALECTVQRIRKRGMDDPEETCTAPVQ
ncbi:MAG: molybdopterin-dependent oxidoreductase [Coriobacteriaceae bacterium]|jgi:anaerobic selenocysteine-containing dehydrogenase|nr:molybdopterin-dependent oxidoreductase [Coriobacteriaceae bacterium]